MKNKEVKINETYVMRISQIHVPVVILQESKHLKGWDGLNLKTGNGVHIRSGQKLRRVLTNGEKIRLNCWLDSDKAKTKSSLLRSYSTGVLIEEENKKEGTKECQQ